MSESLGRACQPLLHDRSFSLVPYLGSIIDVLALWTIAMLRLHQAENQQHQELGATAQSDIHEAAFAALSKIAQRFFGCLKCVWSFAVQTRNTKSRAREPSRFAEASLEDMMDEDEEDEFAAAAAPGWGALVKHDSLLHEQDNVSSSTTVPGMAVSYGNGQHGFGATAAAARTGSINNALEEQSMTDMHRMHEDCQSAAVSE